MNFEGKICGMCNKGKLHKFQDEVERGIFVEAYRCNKCSEVAYSEEVMAKVEAMQRGEGEARRLIQLGSSLAVSIPVEIVKKLRLKPKGKVYITNKGNKIIAWVSTQ